MAIDCFHENVYYILYRSKKKYAEGLVDRGHIQIHEVIPHTHTYDSLSLSRKVMCRITNDEFGFQWYLTRYFSPWISSHKIQLFLRMAIFVWQQRTVVCGRPTSAWMNKLDTDQTPGYKSHCRAMNSILTNSGQPHGIYITMQLVSYTCRHDAAREFFWIITHIWTFQADYNTYLMQRQ